MSFKNWKEIKKNYQELIIDCTQNVSLNDFINSVKSIFSSISNNCTINFLFKECTSETLLLRTICEGLYTEIDNNKDNNNKFKFLYLNEWESKKELIIKIVNDSENKYFCFLKIGVIVSTAFLSKLVFTLNNYKEYYNLGKPGIVLPICNAKVSNQYLVLPEDLHPSKVEEINNKILDLFADNTKSKWIMAGVGCDLCFVLSKDIINKCGFIDDENIDGTTAMTNYLLKLMNFGYIGLVAGDTYVYYPDAEKLISPTPSVLKVQTSDEKKHKTLGVLYKIRLRTENQKQVFLTSLSQTSKFADHIFIVDCSSSIKWTTELKENNIDLYKKITKSCKTFNSVDDKRDYNILLDWAEEYHCDWILSLEGQETFSENVTRADFDKLMNPPNDRICAYALSEFYMWDKDNWRWDGIWLNSSSVRLCRLFPERRILGSGNLASQVGYVPAFPKEYIRFCYLNLILWNFSSEQERQESHKYFSSVDPGQDWKYFLDEKTLQLYPLNLGTVSTYSPVGKGGIKLFEWLDHVWSWSHEILLGNDRNQLENYEIESAKLTYGAKVIDCDMGNNFASGRNTIIKQAKTSHIFQLDIDERLSDPRLLSRLMSSPIDSFMFSIDNLQKGNTAPVITNTVRLFKHRDNKVEYWGYIHETIDDSVRKYNLSVSQSPVNILHYGYLWMKPEYAYDKMQRYISLNLKQMELFPSDPRAYYNLAMHLIEDEIYDTALRLLNISIILSKGVFPSPILELVKVYILKALTVCNHLNKMPNSAKTKEIKEFSLYVQEHLKKVATPPIQVAASHAVNYFNNNKVEREKLNKLLLSVEKELGMV